MRIILYTGKGGVGKTCVAAATACRLAQEGQRVLIMSTDQAHSLSDVFEVTIGGQETLIAPALYGLEIDAVEESEAAWGKMQGYLQQLLTIKSGVTIEAEELLVFPGLEELFALLKILDIRDGGRYDVLIVDCAPTGETLSLLKFPEMFGQFVNRMLPIKRKAVKVAGPAVTKLTKIPMPEDSVFDELQYLTLRLEQLKAVMNDKEQVSIRIVTTAERIVIREAKRNFTWLHLYDYNVDAIVVNRLYPPLALDGYFNHWGNLQQEGLTEIRESFADIPIFTMTLQQQELKSVTQLQAAAREIFGDTDPLPVLTAERIFDITKDGEDYWLSIYLPFADKEDIDLSQKDGELIIGIENTWRRLLLPDILRGKAVERAHYADGVLRIAMR